VLVQFINPTTAHSKPSWFSMVWRALRLPKAFARGRFRTSLQRFGALCYRCGSLSAASACYHAVQTISSSFDAGRSWANYRPFWTRHLVVAPSRHSCLSLAQDCPIGSSPEFTLYCPFRQLDLLNCQRKLVYKGKEPNIAFLNLSFYTVWYIFCALVLLYY